MAENPPTLTPMVLAQYYLGRMAMRVDEEHFQELCRTVAYAIDPVHTAYHFALEYGLTDLWSPDEILHAGRLPRHQGH